MRREWQYDVEDLGFLFWGFALDVGKHFEAWRYVSIKFL